ncbi:MAG: hypothetical protein K8S54_11990 [Spirochaetia bacterium]|nr:hypothetical protein [Spirochaetia bacterium]
MQPTKQSGRSQPVARALGAVISALLVVPGCFRGATNSIPEFTLLGLSQVGRELTSYSIPSLGITGTFQGSNISLASTTLTAFTPLVATFTTTGTSVAVGSVVQESGVTSNSYVTNLVYTVTGTDGSTRDYTVTLTAPRTYGGSSLRIWLKADELALNDGDTVSTWNDLSGLGNNFTQGTPANRPVYRVNQVNGLPAVTIRQATGQSLGLSGASSMYVNNSGSLFAVFKTIQTNAIGTTFLNLGGNQGRQFDISFPTFNFNYGRNGIGSHYTSAFALPSSYLAVGAIQVLQTSSNEIWNGDLKGNVTVAINDYSGAADQTSGYLSNGLLDADLAELLYFNAALSQNETDKVFCYLRNKYNLSATNTSCGL